MAPPVSPAWQARVERWVPAIPFGSHVYDALKTLQHKDLGKLQALIKAHPDLLTQKFALYAKRQDKKSDGFLAHMLVQLGWTSALDCLWEGGDRFDCRVAGALSATSTSEFSAFEYAIFHNKATSVRRMLQLGTNPENARSFLSVYSDRPHYAALVSLLCQKGLDPFAGSYGVPRQGFLLHCLSIGNFHVALGALQTIDRWPSEVSLQQASEAWLNGMALQFQRRTPGGHQEALEKLIRLGAPWPNLGKAVSLSSHTRPAEWDIQHQRLMLFLLEHGQYGEAELKEAWRASEGIAREQSDQWKAELQAKMLNSVSSCTERLSSRPRL